MTFDSPFSAVLLAVWGESPYCPPVVRGGRFFCTQNFVCKTGARVKLPPAGYAPGFGQIAANGGDLSAERRVPVPPCAHAGGQNPPSLPESARQTTGATAARRRGRAHTARQAERARPEAGRQAAEIAGMQGRAPRAQPTAPQARGTRARPPSPAIISARGRTPQG